MGGTARAAARDAAVDAAAERMIAKHHAKDAEIMADLKKVTWVIMIAEKAADLITASAQ